MMLNAEALEGIAKIAFGLAVEVWRMRSDEEERKKREKRRSRLLFIILQVRI